ncbi:MAG: type II secretion system protein [Candidatus Paceibacterota bacterium]
MIKNTLKRGFTLIELLVVIAIIGILASVVLASLNSARDKGEDAAVKANLNNARAQAAIYYDDNDRSYAGLCESTNDGNIAQFIGTNGDCNDGASFWVAAEDLTEGYYCVDSTGSAIETATGTVGTITAESCAGL